LPGNIKFEYGREWIAAAFGTHTLRHRSKPAKAQAKDDGSHRQRHWLRKESTTRPESIESDMFAFEKYCVNCSYDLSDNGSLVMVQLSVFDKLRQTEVFIANHQYKEAINLLQERINDKGADFKATFDLAYCHEKLGQFEKAEEYYVHSLSSPLLKNVTVIPIHSSYAKFLESRGRKEEAFEQLLLIYTEHVRREEDSAASLKRLTALSEQMGMSPAELDARLMKVSGKKNRVRKK
jgi:tetratricopeptide (TPR) repeat protein